MARPGRSRKTTPRIRRARVEALEPRILLSADFPGAEPLLHPPDAEVLELPAPAGSATGIAQHGLRHEIVFIDPGVEGADKLVADLREGVGEGRRIEVVHLDGARDGVVQIGEALARTSVPVDAIHVVSHGSYQGIQLGSTFLSSDNVAEHAGALSQWSEALAGDADLLLYGCNLAAGAAGQALIETLGLLTGTDVAASDDATGAALLGGDWELEYASGAIESEIAFGEKAKRGFGAVLDGTAIWAEDGATQHEVSTFNGSSFSAPTPSADVGDDWNVVIGAEAPTRDEKIVLGVGNDTKDLSGQMWDGTSWTALPIADLGVGLPDDRWAVAVAYESQSGDAMLVYVNDVGGLSYATWDGSLWSASVGIAAPGATPIHMQMAASPDSDEMVLVVGDSVGDAYALVWDGGSWSAGTALPNSGLSPDVTDIQVAYEQQTGEALMVWGGGTTDLQYGTWDGLGFSFGTTSAPGGITGAVEWTSIASDPNSDRIAVGAVTEDRDAWVGLWNGSGWDTPEFLSDDLAHSDRVHAGVAFEGVSGDLLAAYGENGASEIRYRVQSSGGGWTGELLGPDLGDHIDALVLDAEPGSDTIMLSASTNDRDIHFVAWNGGSWGFNFELEIDAPSNTGQPFLYLWDQQSAPTFDGQAIWAAGTSTTPEVSLFEGGVFGPVDDTVDVGNSWNTIAGAESPDRHEAIVAGIGTDGKLSAMVWEDGKWKNEEPFGLGIPNVSESGQFAIDVAYESQSGSALMVWSAGNPAPFGLEMGYAIWNGDSWSGPIPLNGVVAGEAEQIRLAASPNSDEMILVVSNASNEAYAYVWNGSSWDGGTQFASASASTDSTDIQVVYEQQSGHAMVVHATANRFLHTQIWNGATWTQGTVSPPGGVTDPVVWTDLAADPQSDRIVLAATTTNGDTWLATWDGSTWESSILATANAAYTDRLNVSVEFESDSSQALAVYGESGAQQVRYRTWSIGGGWSAEANGAALGSGDDPSVLTLDRDPNSDRIMLSLVDKSKDVHFAEWNGNAFVSQTVLETDATDVKGQPFLFFWQQDSQLTADGLWISTKDDVSGGAQSGINEWGPGQVIQIGDPNLALEPGTTNGTFSEILSLISDLASSDVDVELTGMHLVSTAVTVGGSIDLEAGDVLFAVDKATPMFTSTNSISVDENDIVRFRPDTAGDYSSGTFELVLNDPFGGGSEIGGLSLVERSMSIGGVAVAAGDFLLIENGGVDTTIHHFDVATAGAGTSGTLNTLVDGTDIGIGLSGFSSVHLVSEDVTIAGRFLATGTVLVSISGSESGFAGIPSVEGQDVIALTVTTGGSSTSATGSILFEGADVGMTSGAEKIESLALAVVGVPTPDNAAPTLVPSAPDLDGITEDETNDTGQTVASFLSGVTDPDAGALSGIAIESTIDGNGSWEYSVNGGSSWSAVGSVDPTNALLLRDVDLVRFVPDGENADSASFDFRAWDQSSGSEGTKVDVTTTGGSSAFSDASDTASIAVSAENDAPVLASATPGLTAIDEDDVTNSGDLVSDLLGSTVSDVDTGAIEGIAITALVSSNGTWEYSTNGGGAWSAVGSVDTMNALLLRATDRVRFVPDGLNADSASFDFLAWDQSSGGFGTKVDVTTTGGTTAYSDDANTASITVTGVNDAPVLNPAAPSLTGIDEDDTANSGDLVSDLLGGSVTDADSGAVEGIAVTALASSNGTWEYSTTGGAAWFAVGAVDTTNALLLRATDRIRFVPDAEDADTASFDYVAWDQSSEAFGTKVDVTTTGGTTPFSDASDTASITVTALNDAPVRISNPVIALSVAEDAGPPAGAVGTLVSDLVDFPGGGGLDNVDDVDPGALLGIAVTNAGADDGTWHYSIDDGLSWNPIGSVTNNAALLLAADPGVRVYFEPDPDFSGVEDQRLRFRAWDQSIGASGGTADTTPFAATGPFSSNKMRAEVTVTAVNDAPVLDPGGTMVLTDVLQDDANPPGTSVAGIIASASGDRITDPDPGAVEGIAVTGVDDSDGTWEYSITGGVSWLSFVAQGVADGSVDDANAVLLEDGALIRFVPDAAYNGPAGDITFRAWDRTGGSNGDFGVDVSGNGGITPYSLASETATLTVNPASGIANSVPGAQGLDEDGTLVFAAGNGNAISIDDGGAGDAMLRVSLSVTNGTFTLSGTGGLSFASGANGTAAMTIVGSLANVNAALEGASFTPTGDYNGSASLQIDSSLANLEGHYTFDDTLDLGNDESPAGTNDGVVSGVTAGVDASPRDTVGVFDGSDDIQITGLFGTPTDVTLAAWVNLGAGQADDDVISLGDNVALRVDGAGGVEGFFFDGATWQTTGSATFIAGTGWHHVAYTFDDAADQQVIYIDGTALNTTGFAASISYTQGTDTFLGRNGNGASNFLSGSMDDARVYDRALSASEIAALAKDIPSDSDAVAITVDAVNDAPVGIAVSVSIDEDASYTFGAADFGFSDPVEGDGFAGVVITTAPGTGTLRNGADVLTGGEFVTAAEIAANDLVFTPVGDANGAPYTSFTFQVRDDGGTPNGGADTDATPRTMTIDVDPVNDAPDGTDATVSTAENTAYTFATGDFGFSDPVEGDGFDGIIVTTIPADGTLRDGALVLTGGEFVSAASILANALTFTPVADENGTGYASFTFQVRDDGGTGNGGVNLDPVANTITIDVTPENDAPVLTPAGANLAPISEDQVANSGDLVSAIVGSSITDPDAGDLEGIAITSITSGNGTWEYSLNGGVVWNGVPAVTNASALLLRSTDRIRFVPDAQNATAPSFDFRAWDQTSGTAGTQVDTGVGGGITPYSTATDTASITVSDVNDAPTLIATIPTLAPMTEDDGATVGTQIATVLGASMSDVDAAASEGIAVTALTGTSGTWQFSTNGGGSWSNVGSVAGNNALLLRDVDRIRFRPDGNNGTTATFDFRGWDQSAGSAGNKVNANSTGGTTAFSAVSDTARVDVSSLNDAPTIGGATLDSVPGGTANPPGATVASLFGGSFGDVDSGGSMAGIAVVANSAVPASQGTWQYSSDGGANWFAVGTVAEGPTALALSPTTLVRFLPAGGFEGDPGNLSVRALDDTFAGLFSTTGGGIETRQFANTAAPGGTSAISASTASLDTMIGTPVDPGPTELPPDIEEPPGPEEPPETEDPPETEEPEPVDDPVDDGTPIPVGLGPDPGAPGAPTAAPGFDGFRGTIAPPAPEAIEIDPFEASDPADDDDRAPIEIRQLSFGALRELAASGFEFLTGETSLLGELDRLRDDAEVRSFIDDAVAGSGVAVSAGLSIGYVVWLTRGGLLIASFASSMPAWRLIDPIPVLASLAVQSDGRADQESLQSLVREGAEKAAESDPAEGESDLH